MYSQTASLLDSCAHNAGRAEGPPGITQAIALLAARLAAVARGNVALVGDASGSVDAITGEGIGLSFRQASVLADAMAAGDLRRYDAAHPRLAFRPMLMANLMLVLDRGRAVREVGIGALASAPGVFRKLLEVHAGA